MMSLWQPTVSESSYFATLLEYEHNSNTMEWFVGAVGLGYLDLAAIE